MIYILNDHCETRLYEWLGYLICLSDLMITISSIFSGFMSLIRLTILIRADGNLSGYCLAADVLSVGDCSAPIPPTALNISPPKICSSGHFHDFLVLPPTKRIFAEACTRYCWTIRIISQLTTILENVAFAPALFSFRIALSFTANNI